MGDVINLDAERERRKQLACPYLRPIEGFEIFPGAAALAQKMIDAEDERLGR
jgi:hypothetical protein